MTKGCPLQRAIREVIQKVGKSSNWKGAIDIIEENKTHHMYMKVNDAPRPKAPPKKTAIRADNSWQQRGCLKNDKPTPMDINAAHRALLRREAAQSSGNWRQARKL